MRKIAIFFILSCTAKISYTQIINDIQKDQPAWSQIAAEISQYDILCLGEESHWVETFLEVKLELIKHLHQKGDFKVLIFESGFVNSFMAYEEQLNDREHLEEALYTIWQTKSTLALFRYQTAEWSDGNFLWFWGCDLKGPKSFRFSRYLHRKLKRLNAAYAEEMRKVDSSFVELRSNWEPAIGKAYRGTYLPQQKANNIRTAYVRMRDSFAVHRELIFESLPTSEIRYQFTLQCLANRIHLLDLMPLPTHQEKHQFRDSIMAENTQWLMTQWAPNHNKYMLWGADIHLSKNAKWEANGSAWQSNRSLVEHLMEKTSKSIFSVGIKARKRLDKSIRKELNLKSSKVYWMNQHNLLKGSEMPFADEHDALIICGTIKGLNKLKRK